MTRLTVKYSQNSSKADDIFILMFHASYGSMHDGVKTGGDNSTVRKNLCDLLILVHPKGAE